MRLIICVIILFLLFACHRTFNIPIHPAILNEVITPILLVNDTARVNLTDYFENPEKIKKIIPSHHIHVTMEEGKKSMLLILSEKTGIAGNIRFKYEDYNYDIPVFKCNITKIEEVPVIFTDKIKGDTIYIKKQAPVTEWFVYLQHCRVPESFLTITDHHIGIILPKAADVLPKGKLHIWAVNNAGISNNISVPLNQGKAVVETTDTTLLLQNVMSDKKDLSNLHVYNCAIDIFPDPQKSFIQLDLCLKEYFLHKSISNTYSDVPGFRQKPEITTYVDGKISLDAACELSNRIYKTENACDKLFQLLVFDATLPPCLGGHYRADGDTTRSGNRHIYFAGENKKEVMFRKKCTDLNRLKRHSTPLMYGDFIPLRAENHIYAYLRSYFGKNVVVVFNRKAEMVTLRLDLPEQERDSTFKSLFNSRFSYNNSKLIMDVPANGAEIVYN